MERKICLNLTAEFFICCFLNSNFNKIEFKFLLVFYSFSAFDVFFFICFMTLKNILKVKLCCHIII